MNIVDRSVYLCKYSVCRRCIIYQYYTSEVVLKCAISSFKFFINSDHNGDMEYKIYNINKINDIKCKENIV